MEVNRVPLDEKLIREFLSLGCSSRKEAAVCYQVFLDLCEVKRLYDVQYQHNTLLNRMYITGRLKTKDLSQLVYIPVPVSTKIDISTLQNILEVFKIQYDIDNIHLAIVSSDSTIVYYKLNQGLVPPTDENLTKCKREKLMACNDTVLQHNRHVLESAAMFNTPVALNAQTSKVPEPTSDSE